MPVVDGNRWKNRRAELDIPVEAAASTLRISKRTLQNIETTEGYYASLEVIYRATRLYSCSVEWLQGKDEPAPPTPKDPPKREPSGDPKGPDPRKDKHGPKRAALRAAS